MELVDGKWRTISGVSYLFPVPLSYIAFAGIAFFIYDWQDIQLAITLPAVLLLGLWWLVFANCHVRIVSQLKRKQKISSRLHRLQ